jgi:hypothetical protein
MGWPSLIQIKIEFPVRPLLLGYYEDIRIMASLLLVTWCPDNGG